MSGVRAAVAALSPAKWILQGAVLSSILVVDDLVIAVGQPRDRPAGAAGESCSV